jgi:hypothetical protein
MSLNAYKIQSQTYKLGQDDLASLQEPGAPKEPGTISPEQTEELYAAVSRVNRANWMCSASKFIALRNNGVDIDTAKRQAEDTCIMEGKLNPAVKLSEESAKLGWVRKPRFGSKNP